MIISDKLRCIFVRVPKTGSTSVEELLLRLDPECTCSDNDTPPYGHFRASQLRTRVGEQKWRDYFTFAFVRDPIDWVRSQYTYNMRYYYHYPALKLLMDPNTNRLHVPDDRILTIHHVTKLHIMLNEWFKGGSQSVYLDEPLDYIGTTEDLANGLNTVLRHLRVANNNSVVRLPHSNRSGSETYQLDNDARAFVEMTLRSDRVLYSSARAAATVKEQPSQEQPQEQPQEQLQEQSQ